MKAILKTLILLIFMMQMAFGQSSTRFFSYDDAGNRYLRKDPGMVEPEGCPDNIAGYIKLGEYEGHAYFMSESMAKWEDAKILAENEGGYLATMNNQAENDWLKGKLGNTMAFIGYNDAITEGTMQWANNEPIGLVLDLGYDNSSSNDYGLMNFWAGTWQLVGPWQARNYVLEIDCDAGPTGNLTISCPDDINVITNTGASVVSWNAATATTTCSVNTNVTITQTSGQASASTFAIGMATVAYEASDNCNNTKSCSFSITVTAAQSGGCGEIAGFTMLGEFGGHGYYMSNANASWSQANTQAQNAGGYLATMNTQAENDFLKDQLDNEMVFIGYNDGDVEGEGKWANNEPVTLDLSYDNSSERDYAVMNFWAGTWQLVNQGVYKKYILEMDCSPTAPPQATPEATIKLKDLVIYPNPTGGIFTIQNNDGAISQNAEIYFYSSEGALVFRKGFGEGSFDISNLADGTYFLVVQDGKSRYQLKVVKGD